MVPSVLRRVAESLLRYLQPLTVRKQLPGAGMLNEQSQGDGQKSMFAPRQSKAGVTAASQGNGVKQGFEQVERGSLLGKGVTSGPLNRRERKGLTLFCLPPGLGSDGILVQKPKRPFQGCCCSGLSHFHLKSHQTHVFWGKSPNYALETKHFWSSGQRTQRSDLAVAQG